MWTPPNAAFGPVWAVLYTLIAVSGWLVWRRHEHRAARLALPLFVVAARAEQPLDADLLRRLRADRAGGALDRAPRDHRASTSSVAATIAAFWPVSRLAAVLLVPYLLWILYASTLNWGDAALVTLG